MKESNLPMTRDEAITALVGEMHHEIFRVGDRPALGVPVEQVQRWADTLSALGPRFSDAHAWEIERLLERLKAEEVGHQNFPLIQALDAALSALGGRPETSQQDAERRAIGNCYMMAKREIARLLNSRDVIDEKSLERWQHVLRFCESVGCKSDILRWQIPTELTEGGRPETGPEHRCGVRGFAESGDQCPACHVPGGRHAPLQEQP